MPVSHENAQARGRIGGLRRAALAPSRQGMTQAARDAKFRKYIDEVRAARPEITDEGELIRRAELLQHADMIAMSQKASRARKLKADLRPLDTDLAGSDFADYEDDDLASA